MNLILLTVKTRGNATVNKQMLIDVDDIATPLKKTGTLGGDTTFSLREGKKGPFAHFNTGTALTTYVVDETLAQINALANEIFVANVSTYKCRPIAGTPEMGFNMKFVAGYIERDTVDNVSRFFYQEDSDPALVNYAVTQTLAQIIAQLNTQYVESVTGPNVDNTDPWNPIVNDGSVPIPMIRADFLPPFGAGTLSIGKYLITDRADQGVVLDVFNDANGNISVSKNGSGIYLVNDYGNVGDYSGVASYTGIPLGTVNHEVWESSMEAGLSDGDILFWDGYHYQVISTAAFAGTSPSATPLAYEILPKNIAESLTFGYIKNTDRIVYDVISDIFSERADSLGNLVKMDNAIDGFQWGNPDVSKCNILAGVYNCINQKGQISSITIVAGDSLITSDNTHKGIITHNTFGGEVTLILNMNSTFSFSSNYFYDTVNSFIIDGTVNHTNKTYDNGYSTFDGEADMSVDFAAGVLTVPLAINYAGVITLNNNTGQTITKIAATFAVKKRKYIVEAGNSQTFSHTAIGVAVAENLVSDAAAANIVVGRANGGDFIEYERLGNLNVRSNAAIMA